MKQPEIVIDDELYRPVPPRHMSEVAFEREIVRRAELFFPGWQVCEFKVDIDATETQHGRKRADIALVDPEFRAWWVLEIEMSHHSVEQHVLPQVEVLALGAYGQPHLQTLRKQLALSPENAARLRQLVENQQPRILVVVNDFVPSWEPLLSQLAQVMIIRPFVDALGRRAYLVDGARPSKEGAYIVLCKREPVMPQSLTISEPNRVNFADAQQLEILVDGGITIWRFHRLGPNAFLFAKGPFPFDHGRDFVLGRDASGRLFLKLVTSQNRRHIK